MTQHLGTFNKIVFTKGVLLDRKCIRIVFGWGSALDPTYGGAVMLPKTS